MPLLHAYIYVVYNMSIWYMVIYTNTLLAENIFHMNNISNKKWVSIALWELDDISMRLKWKRWQIYCRSK